MAYSGQAGYKPDYLYLMQRLMMDNPEAAVNLAKMIAKQPGPPMDLNTLADLFLQRNAVREATAFLLDVLQENKPEHDKLQTKVDAAVVITLKSKHCHIPLVAHSLTPQADACQMHMMMHTAVTQSLHQQLTIFLKLQQLHLVLITGAHSMCK